MRLPRPVRLLTALALVASTVLAGCHSGSDDPPPPVPSVALATSPSAVTLGAAVQLTWSSSNVTACTAAGSWSGSKAPSGSESVTPSTAGNATYTLTCTGAGGSANASSTVVANAPPPSAPTATLTPAASTVIVGGSTTLTWSSTNATSCTASDAWSGTKATSGTESVTPPALGSATYTLTCTGAGGSIVVATTVNAINSLNFILSTNEVGSVSVFSRNGTTGIPTQVSGSPFPAGGTPRGVVVHPSNRFAYVENTSTLSISMYSIDEVSGALSALPGSPFALDYASIDLALNPAGTFLYVATQEGLFTFAVNPTTGGLTKVGTVPPGYHGTVAIHPSGRFAYATGAGPSGGAAPFHVYAIDNAGGLTPITGSPFAGRSGTGSIVIDPSGEFVFAGVGVFDAPGSIYAYSINATTGALTAVVGNPFPAVTGPWMMAIDPQGAFLYLACNGGPTHFGGLLGYSINRSTGALTALSGSPFSPGDHYSMSVGIDRAGSYVYETRWRAGSPSELRTLSIGSAGVLTEVPSSRVLIGLGWASGIALTR